MEHKTFPISLEAKIDDGESLPNGFVGHGSIFSNIDSHGDIVEPGAFAESLESFIQNGHIGYGHRGYDDYNFDVGIITDAKETTEGLFVEARFHDTRGADDVRKIVKHRMENGKSMGLSIGYEVESARFDAKGIRHLEAINLFEVSLVPFPANPKAQVVSVKQNDPSDIKAESAWADKLKNMAELLTELAGLLETGAYSVDDDEEQSSAHDGDAAKMLARKTDEYIRRRLQAS